jgi:hypothetical protein
MNLTGTNLEPQRMLVGKRRLWILEEASEVRDAVHLLWLVVPVQ